MKKKDLKGGGYTSHFERLLLIMKLSILMIFSGLMTVSASIYPESTKLKLDLNNVSVPSIPSKVIESLRENSEQPQKKDLSGTVKDETGLPLPGVSVVVMGTTIGTITDANGQFKLSVPGDAKTLIFSFIGMKSQEIPITRKTIFSVVMEEVSIGLEEVVAIGYGTIRKSDLTGSVAKVTNERSAETTNSSMEQMLQGKAAGVQIIQNTGAPGEGMTFLVRGANSMSGNNQPLVVLDGYPLESGDAATSIGSSATFFTADAPAGNALAGINPNDIESVEILKDASATAIYGSRGANGVILITTKRGKSGRDKIEYTFRSDVSFLRKQIDVLHSQDYMNFANEAYINSAKEIPYTPEFFDGRYPDNDWQSMIFQTSFSQDHQLSISGGDKDMKYAIIGGYTDLEGIVKYSSRFKRGSVRVNLDRNIGNRLKIGTNITGSMTYNEAVLQSPSDASGINASPILGALFGRPIQTAYNEDGSVNTSFQGNPLTVLKLNTIETNVKSLLFNAFGILIITKDLSFKINGGTNLNYSNRDMYYPRGTYTGNQLQGSAYKGDVLNQNFLLENTLIFNKTIRKKHRISAVAGYTYQNWLQRRLGITVSGFANDHLTFYNLGAGNVVSKPNTLYQEYALSSFLGRANYTFNDRYMFTFSVRSDGSTRLAEGHKWATFPSLALGWNVHKEAFMKDIKAISELKLRGSYGISGNQSVNVGQTQSYYTTVPSLVNSSSVTGYYQGNLGNNQLGWETTSQLNLGLNLGLLANRFTFGFDYYQKRTTDLLLSAPLPGSSGFNNIMMNSGETKNWGYEFELGAVILKGPVKWNVSGNLSINRNEVVSLGDYSSIYGPRFAIYTQNSNWHIAMPGYPIGSFYGYKLDGIYQTQEEIDNGPKETVSGIEPGLWKFKDVSGPEGKPDGIINTDDLTIIGNPYPDFTFGITNNLSYKNFSLSFFIMGTVGNDLLNMNNYILTGMDMTKSPNNLTVEAYNNRWTGPGTSNFYAKPTASVSAFYNRANDAIVEDGTFYRLKNLTLSYDIPVKKLNVFSSLKVFATGTNLITITNYSGFDPEISSRGRNAMSPGVDLGAIPQLKSYSFGLTMNF
jgi:TonB-linked SusC/RagA family outer membrane protein